MSERVRVQPCPRAEDEEDSTRSEHFTFLLQDGAGAASADVVLHVTGVVAHVCLLHSVKDQRQLHLLLPQKLPQQPEHTHISMLSRYSHRFCRITQIFKLSSCIIKQSMLRRSCIPSCSSVLSVCDEPEHQQQFLTSSP